MAYINFDNVTLRYPIYNSRGFSLRNHLLRVGTGGLIDSEVGSVNYITALKNISFKIKEGDSVGIMGHNGAGKTTLLRTIAGIYRPNSGNIAIQGKFATLFEQGACMEVDLTGYDNIYRMCLMLGIKKKEVEKKIGEIEEFTELGNFLQLPIRTYSTGMAMRLNFAISTSEEPEVLLMDEIFAAGDQAFQIKARLRLNGLIDSAKILILASHSMEMVKEYCNRLLILEHGILREESIKDIK